MNISNDLYGIILSLVKQKNKIIAPACLLLHAEFALVYDSWPDLSILESRSYQGYLFHCCDQTVISFKE